MKHGSCNAQYFLVHYNSTVPGYVGSTFSDRSGGIEWYGISQDTEKPGIIHSRYAGEEWGWSYNSDVYNHATRIIRSGSNDILYIWEADSIIDQNRPSYSPIIETNPRTNESIIPIGGSSIWANVPDQDSLLSIENDIINAVAPAWSENTLYDQLNAEEIYKRLMKTSQYEFNLTYRGTITEIFSYQEDIVSYKAYIYIFMRSASKILYNHYGNSMIPLLLDKFYCDEYGNLDLK